MRRLRRYALAVSILLLATGCDASIPGTEKTMTAAELAAVTSTGWHGVA